MTVLITSKCQKYLTLKMQILIIKNQQVRTRQLLCNQGKLWQLPNLIRKSLCAHIHKITSDWQKNIRLVLLRLQGVCRVQTFLKSVPTIASTHHSDEHCQKECLIEIGKTDQFLVDRESIEVTEMERNIRAKEQGLRINMQIARQSKSIHEAVSE
ncbi:hypothetical protein FGO68_gene17385 [Halteria grandinella]|uniref:Uncharacterized protein n=1 Tax=Halteria grandinella TaxID=5974 RepID=A0A8J8NKV3_HALGN|nr:hypothetical protein FGO68_gene17385 [Halteria grandinella]